MNRADFAVFSTALAVCFAGACQQGVPITSLRSVSSAAPELVPLQGCDQVANAIRDGAIAEMNTQLDAMLQGYLSGNGIAPIQGTGQAGPMAANSDRSATQTSGTNNQVPGVDESDFVKNDNQYIYAVSHGALRIIRAFPAPEMREIARVPIEGVPSGLYQNGDRLLVYSSLNPNPQSSADSFPQSSCTYGYDCQFTGDGFPAKLTVFDIADRSSPKLVRELRSSGSYLNARRIGNAVHTVLSAGGLSFPGVSYSPSHFDSLSPDAIRAAFRTLRQQNIDAIRATDVISQLPSVSDTVYGDGTAITSRDLLGNCEGFYAPSKPDGSEFITVLSLDLTDNRPGSATTIVSHPGAAYATESSLYLAVPRGQTIYPLWDSAIQDQTTDVHKFALSASPPSSKYVAGGTVQGRVLNQFSMDEDQGYLRIATTTGRVPSPDVHSTVTVLETQGSTLAAVGPVDQIAPSEDIRAVRFEGDRAYVVTFKKTDPLFVLDLSDPHNPFLQSELKIPGFSTYIHRIDAGHLLTIGYDAQDQGDFAWFAGVLLQLFDVQDPQNPALLHKEYIGTRGSSSEALTNHLAFNYFAPLNLLALPMAVCEGGSGSSYGTELTFYGLMVYTVTLDKGFQLKGKVAHPNSGNGGYDNSVCSNWWSNASTEVKRSIIMDPFIYSVSDSRIKANRLDQLSKDVSEVSLAR